MSSRSSSGSRASDTAPADQASHHSKYRLRVTAGPSYDTSSHKLVAVNAPETLTFESPHMIISLAVRIRHFTGFPESSPVTSESYFSHPIHKSDQYSISFSFIPKVSIRGSDLVFGNDFERPIRDRLPPGFNQAFKIVKWWIDPGLDGDVYADKPYLYGPALSSWNYFRIGEQVIDDPAHVGDTEEKQGWKMPGATSFHETVVEEGADGTGSQLREALSLPSDAAARKKFYLTPSNLEAFTFEAGRLYQSDFGNPYLDFNDFSMKLPGFSLNVLKYIDSKSHELRYTLKNRATGEVYAVVLFNLLFGEDLRDAEREMAAGEVDGSEDRVKGTGAGAKAALQAESKTESKTEAEQIPEDDDDID